MQRSVYCRKILFKEARVAMATTMNDLLKGDAVEHLETGDVVEGTISDVGKRKVWVDLGAQGVGIVTGKEIGYGKKLNVGDTATLSVIDSEMEEGYALLKYAPSS